MRIVAIAVLTSMCHVPAVFAGETLRQAAVRAADQLAAAEAAAAARAKRTEATQTIAVAKKPLAGKPRANFQQVPRGLEGSGMSTGWKILIAGGVAAALAGIMLSIDGGVEDNTPSTKGERTNEPF
jgi:hypothetical protein